MSPPLDNSLEDQRLYHFFDTIGTASCRQKIYQFQVFLLRHEKEVGGKAKVVCGRSEYPFQLYWQHRQVV